MQFRRQEALNKYTLANGIPKFSHVFWGVFIFYSCSILLRAIYEFIYIDPKFWSKASSDKVEIQLILTQLGFIPIACIILLLINCFIRKPNKTIKAIGWLAALGILTNIFQVSWNFLLHLISVENSNPYLFVVRFAQLTIYLYIIGLTTLVSRMSVPSKLEWKLFDIIMLTLALFAFSGAVIQKTTGPLNFVGAIAVITGSFAFALKFCKSTCEYYSLYYEHRMKQKCNANMPR